MRLRNALPLAVAAALAVACSQNTPETEGMPAGVGSDTTAHRPADTAMVAPRDSIRPGADTMKPTPPR